MLEPLFNNVVGLKVCKFIKIRLNTGVFLLILRSLKLFEAGKPLAVAPGVVGGWSPLPFEIQPFKVAFFVFFKCHFFKVFLD